MLLTRSLPRSDRIMQLVRRAAGFSLVAQVQTQTRRVDRVSGIGDVWPFSQRFGIRDGCDPMILLNMALRGGVADSRTASASAGRRSLA